MAFQNNYLRSQLSRLDIEGRSTSDIYSSLGDLPMRGTDSVYRLSKSFPVERQMTNVLRGLGFKVADGSWVRA